MIRSEFCNRNCNKFKQRCSTYQLISFTNISICSLLNTVFSINWRNHSVISTALLFTFIQIFICVMALNGILSCNLVSKILSGNVFFLFCLVLNWLCTNTDKCTFHFKVCSALKLFILDKYLSVTAFVYCQLFSL